MRTMRRRRKSVPNSRVRAIMSRVGFQAWVLGDLGAVVTVLPPVGNTTTRARDNMQHWIHSHKEATCG